ncbi:MAG: ketoacyl-ACP synthase III, partial [Candidatus Cloacimonetes bacterium]|nr:ketoacyl-ACP synthase III [Candidatus Cloacimonadota bacterium]
KFDSFGSYVPPKIVNNYDLERLVDTSDEWIKTRTGMFERHFCETHEAASDLAFQAAEKAIYSSKSTRLKDIQMIIVGTISGDHPFPATACILQQKLGLKDIPAFDVSAGCTGFIYAADIARRYIESGIYDTILVVGVEVLTKLINWSDRGTCVLFGDGAGAAIMKRAEKNELSRIIDSKIGADASEWELLIQKAGGSRYPASEATLKENAHTVYMEGNKIFKHAVRSMYNISVDLMKKNNMDVKDIDWVVSHQANLRIIDALADKFKAPKSKVIVSIEKYANTSSSSIPLAVTDAINEGKIRKGDIVLLTAFGAGLTYGSLIFRY